MPSGPFETMADMLPVFINVGIILGAEARSVIAIPVRASAFCRQNYLRLLNADLLADIAKPARVSASISAFMLMNV